MSAARLAADRKFRFVDDFDVEKELKAIPASDLDLFERKVMNSKRMAASMSQKRTPEEAEASGIAKKNPRLTEPGNHDLGVRNAGQMNK
jgi:hypothetical protein